MDYESGLAGVYVAVGLLSTLLGLVILRENSGARLNRVTALMLFFAGVGAVLGAGSLLDSQIASSRPDRLSMIANFAYLWEFFFPSLLLFAATFPQERLWLRKHAWGELLIFVPHTIHFFLMFVATIWGTSFGLDRVSHQLPIVTGLAGLVRVLLLQFFKWHRYLFSLVNLSYVLVSVFLIWRNLTSVENSSLKTQLRVILLGIGIGVVLYSIGVPLNVLLDIRLSATVSSTLLVAALACWAGTMAYAIVRHRFLDARWIVRRTILYALASAVIVGIYLQIVRALGKVMLPATRVPPGVLEWVALVVPLILFQPIMARLEDSLEGWMMRGRRELQGILERLSQEMALSLDFRTLARGLVHELPEALTARAAAVLIRPEKDPEGRPFTILASQGFVPEVLEFLQGASPHLPSPAAVGRPHTVRDWVEVAIRSGKDPREAERWIRGTGIHLTYDLRHSGERLGLFVLGAKLSGMRYSGEEIRLLSSLGTQAGVALKNSFLYLENLEKAVLEEELTLARRIQQAFLPSNFPPDLPVDVHGLNLPSKQVGGDYYDFFPVRGGGFALAIADVAGKGVGAALLASMLQASLRTLLKDGASPGHVAERVNSLLCESTTPEQFVTLFLAHLDVERRELTYCNAGHNYPILKRHDHGCELLEPSQLVLGIDEKISYSESTISLQSVASVLLYTDGVTEARSPHGVEFGEERLLGFIAAQNGDCAEAIVRQIREEVLRFTETSEVQDDMTLLCLRLP